MSEGKKLLYFVLSKNYDKISKDLKLIKWKIDNGDLEPFILSARNYAKITIKPKFGVL